VEEVCPRCGKREIEPNAREGWCSACIIEDRTERYAEEDRRRAEDRRHRWGDRTLLGEEERHALERLGEQPETRPDAMWAALRQQRHRLREVVRPKEPVPPEAEPWAISAGALQLLAASVKPALKSNTRARAALEEACERIRWLSWGPAMPIDARGATEPQLEHERDFAGWEGSWRRSG